MTGIVQRSRPEIDCRRAVPLSVEPGVTLCADVRVILRAVRKDALSLCRLAGYEDVNNAERLATIRRRAGFSALVWESSREYWLI